jgi:hypothetical protein
LNSFALALATWGLVGIFQRDLPEQLAQAGHWQFLTNLSLIVTITAIVSNYLVMLSDSNGLSKLNIVLNASALVLETLVALIYWVLKLFFIKLIVPHNVPVENFIPLPLDLTIHLFPVTYLSNDYYLNRTDSFRLPLLFVIAIVSSLTTAYWYILEALIEPPAHYPYPFLNVETEERAKIFVVVAILGLVFYQVYEYVHSLVRKRIEGTVKAKGE